MEQKISRDALSQENSNSKPLNYEKICRICANCTDQLLGIFSPEGVLKDLANKMNLHLPFKISQNDLLPLNCCFDCASVILTWDELVVKSIEANKKLQEIYGEQSKQLKCIPDMTVCSSSIDGTDPDVNNSSLILFCQDAKSNSKKECNNKKSISHKLNKWSFYIPQDTSQQELCNLKCAFTTELGKIPNGFSESNDSDLANILFIELKEECNVQAKELPNLQYSLQTVPENEVHTNSCIYSSLSSLSTQDSNGNQQLKNNTSNKNPALESSNDCNNINDEKAPHKSQVLLRTLSELEEENIQESLNNQCLDSFSELYKSGGSTKEAKSDCKNDNHSKKQIEKLPRQVLTKMKTSGILKYDNKVKEKIEFTKNKKGRLKVLSKRETVNVFNYICEFCSSSYLYKEEIMEHVRKMHPDKTSTLDSISDIKIIQNKQLQKQRKLDHEALNSAKVTVEGRVYYNCNICSKNLHSPYTYIWHMRIHSGEKPYVCDLCGKQFRVSQGLIRHLRETHEGIKNFGCDICGRMFATKRNVEEHRRIHTNERPYVCDHCGKAFKQKASLYVHNRSHSDSFPFKCSYCDLRFRTRPPMMIHITRHTGEKPYPCDTCGRQFRIKYELKRHMLIHSDEKPFTCTECGVSFRQKRYLRNHNKINHLRKNS